MRIINNHGQEITVPKDKELIVRQYISSGNHDMVTNLFNGPDQKMGGGPMDMQDGGKLKIRDDRKIDAVTGMPMSDNLRFHATTDSDHIKNVVYSAKKHGIDPYTAIAINLAETRFDPQYKNNPFMLGNYNPYGDVIDESMKFLSDKLKLAKKLGKTSEEAQLQVYNGTGPIKGKGIMYGIDTNKTPINPLENPVYGKRVVNLRDSVLKKNPDLVKLVTDSSYGLGGGLDKLPNTGRILDRTTSGGNMKDKDENNENVVTQYNGGGTHEQNSNGGIQIGGKAKVEDGEVRVDFEDGSYIFSNRF
jgi:hypothetical protein